MAGRFLLGRHPVLGTYGAWMSKPGIEVGNATQRSQFLLSPDYKCEQIVAGGAVSLTPWPAAGSSVNVVLPYALDVAPCVSFMETVDGGTIFHPFRYDLWCRTDLAGGYGVSCNSTPGNISFLNTSEYNLLVFYVVYNRSVLG